MIIDELRAKLPKRFDLPFALPVSTSVTLSTFHGCPVNEIEKICRFLLVERGLNVIVKMNPPMLGRERLEHLLHEVLDQLASEEQSLNLEKIRGGIAASIACHAAIKVNMPLEQNKMEWLLAELAKTDCPMSCPHGRPVVLRYSMKDIQKAFKRI